MRIGFFFVAFVGLISITACNIGYAQSMSKEDAIQQWRDLVVNNGCRTVKQCFDAKKVDRYKRAVATSEDDIQVQLYNLGEGNWEKYEKLREAITQQGVTILEAQPEQPDIAKPNTSDKEKASRAQEILDTFYEKFKFGVGLGFEAYKDDYIQEVETIGDNRIVRVSEKQSFLPSLWLESHFLFGDRPWQKRHNLGPFVAVKVLGDDGDMFEGFT